MEPSYTEAKLKALAFAAMLNCTEGGAAAVRSCLRSKDALHLGLLPRLGDLVLDTLAQRGEQGEEREGHFCRGL